MGGLFRQVRDGRRQELPFSDWGYGGNGDGDDGTVLLWRLTVAVHGGVRGMRGVQLRLVTLHAVLGGKTPFFLLLFFFSLSLVGVFLFTLILLNDVMARKLLKISLAHF